MLRAAELRRCARGEVVLHEGAPADGFFMVARGVAEVTRDAGATVLARPGEGAVIGEMALLSNAPRMATVTIADDADLLFFGGAALAAASSELTVVASTLERFVHQRVLTNLLATHPIFKPFDEAQRHALAARFETLTCPIGTAVIQQGSVGRGLFVVLSGEVRVSAHGEHGEHELARLGSTDVFGEIALLRDAPTTATVTATRETRLLMLERALFGRLVDAVPALRTYFESLAEHRWIDTSLALSGGAEVDVLI
jgi:cAMP-dependent protein kinase regulator